MPKIILYSHFTRTESLKKEKPKRTLSLKTRRHTQSFKDKYKLPAELPPSEMEGMLERKQELQSGGKKATIRSWKNYYTVLCGQLLCFFKDRHGESNPVQRCRNRIFFLKWNCWQHVQEMLSYVIADSFLTEMSQNVISDVVLAT